MLGGGTVASSSLVSMGDADREDVTVPAPVTRERKARADRNGLVAVTSMSMASPLSARRGSSGSNASKAAAVTCVGRMTGVVAGDRANELPR